MQLHRKSTLRYLYVISLPTEAAGLDHTYATTQRMSTNKQVNSNMNVHVHVDARMLIAHITQVQSLATL